MNDQDAITPAEDPNAATLWTDSYVSVAELRRFACAHGVRVSSHALKYEIVAAIRDAGLEPPRPGLHR
jgi:hypothetical protein